LIAGKASHERLLKHVKAAERILSTTKNFDARAPGDYKRQLRYTFKVLSMHLSIFITHVSL